MRAEIDTWVGVLVLGGFSVMVAFVVIRAFATLPIGIPPTGA
jgi:hypothetical protein